MATKQATRQAITLKGSTAIVTEFFEYSVNSILYQRGVYPSDDFRVVKKYGLPLTITNNDSLKEYIETILEQVSEWLMTASITRLVLAIKSTETDETLERWQFDIHHEGGDTQAGTLPGAPKPKRKKDKTEKEVQTEIRDIMKQITSTNTFLPILEDECTFNILAYTTENGIEVPATWSDSDPHLIDRGKVEQVRLRTFTTNVHSLEAMVAYRVEE